MTSWPIRFTVVAVTSLVLVAFGCGGDDSGGPTGLGPPPGLAACGSAPFLTGPLVPIANVQFVVPLGNLNPPGHTFPTDHIYLYMGSTAGIYAPGAIVVTSVVRQRRTGGGQPSVEDYAVTFFPCADVMIQLGHVARLGTQLSAKLGTFDEGCGTPTQAGGFTYEQCRKEANIPFAAGVGIGATSFSLDVLARDRRVTLSYVNPARLSDPVGAFGDTHAACPLDYFEASVADPLRAKLGPPGRVRTTPPVCGEVMTDVPGTAAGRWFLPGSPTYPEDPHLALAHDNIAPALAAFSVGTSVPSLPSNVYTFTPASSGRVNLDFRYVTTVGEIECYETNRNTRVLLQLVSASRLRLQGIGPGTCGAPSTWALGAGAVEFER